MNTENLSGGAAVGALVTVYLTHEQGAPYTDVEFGMMLAGFGTIITYTVRRAEAIIRHFLGTSEGGDLPV